MTPLHLGHSLHQSAARLGRFLASAGGVILVSMAVGCGGNSPAPSFDNPFDPSNGQGLPVPDSLSVTVASNIVRLCWGLPDSASADEFAVFRQRFDPLEAEVLLDVVRDRCYLDSGVRNGRTYAYRIASGVGGRFGPRSERLLAQPAVFSIVIAGGAPKTSNPDVLVAITGAGVESVRLSENPDELSSAPPRPVTPTLQWRLSSGDGQKTLYASFLLQDGNETLPEQGSIVLDTQAVILEVDFSGPGVCVPGDTIHFRMNAAETGGRVATISVSGGFLSALQLFDDGQGGDAVPRDGVYERDYVIPAGSSISSAIVTGNFTDDVGNVATPFRGARLLTVQVSPAPVTFIPPPLFAEPPADAAVTLRWTRSQATDFAAYQVYRSESVRVDSTSQLVGSVGNVATTQFTDTDVIEGHMYMYRVYVTTTAGLQRGSVQTLAAAVPNLRPPDPVTPEEVLSVGTTSLTLRWSPSRDRDFARYLVHRSEERPVTDLDSLVASLSSLNVNYFQDHELLDNKTYYYIVIVEDEGGLRSAPSREVSATTENEPPRAVQLLIPAVVETTLVQLEWEASDDRDFASYQLYRDESPAVNTSSNLVAEIDARETTGFPDTTVEPKTTYYYRIYVADTAGDRSPGSTPVMATTPAP